VTISGKALDKPAGVGAAGLYVALSGDASATAQTDAEGRYTFANLPAGGAYTVMLTSPGWVASPRARTFLDCRADKSADFDAAPETDGSPKPGPILYYVDVSGGACPECDPLPGTGGPTGTSGESAYFVAYHYLDFLGRGPDGAGLNFWKSEIESCGEDAQCREVKRVNVSAAFFLSIEFQQTGYLAYRAHKAAFGDIQGKPVPVTLGEMLQDVRVIGDAVVVGMPGWERRLEQNKQTYFDRLAATQRFTTLYPQTLAPEQFVDALDANAGRALSQSERDALVNDLKNGVKTRAQVVRAVAEDADLSKAEFNRAFVLMQYFGYLRRDPDAAPDADFSGFNYWLGKLNGFGGNFVEAEMVKAFLDSAEYRRRFGR
jgi:hypothetical protein